MHVFVFSPRDRFIRICHATLCSNQSPELGRWFPHADDVTFRYVIVDMLVVEGGDETSHLTIGTDGGTFRSASLPTPSC